MKTHVFDWAVIGAGPAGIAAVGKLLDEGLRPEKILWIDPYFKVGDLGRFWRNVSSNTKVLYFNHFLNAANSFAYKQAPLHYSLNQLNPEKTCTLAHVVEPLQWITNQFTQQVSTQQATIDRMFLSAKTWFLCASQNTFKASNVILAPGAIPFNLNYPNAPVIPFYTAIDKQQLSLVVDVDKTYAVFGSSHSAIIIVRHLVELGVKRVINFYRSPCRYAVDMGDWILFDSTGLKGETASWARDHIDGITPHNLVRYNADESTISQFLPECDKVIYAVGFKRRNSIAIGDYQDIDYNPHVGIIGPGLFGLGIAYPELKSDPFGSVESQVGLWKFMVYLNKVMPI